MADYALTDSEVVVRTSDAAHIPDDPENRDRIAYDKWLADGGVPDPFLTPVPTPQWDWGPRFVEVMGGPNVR